jgi:2-hydroxychromene-2-carboxylate isomerase
MFTNPARLYFCFDFISHNAWLAWHQLPALARRVGLSVEPVPVLFAALLKEYGQVGPAELPAKSRWMLWNVLRKAKMHGIPIAPPHSHPFNPLLMLRVCAAELPQLTREARADLVTRFFRATWAERRPVHTVDTVHEVVTEAGLDADAVLAAAQAEPAKRQVRDNTDAALRAGVFGVPSVLVGGELFWGFDDLPFLEQYLQGGDPLGPDRTAYREWLAIKPSAERRK